MDMHSVIGVTALAKSLPWYEAFFGKPADEVIGEEHLWQVGENAYVVLDERPVRAKRVGGTMITFGVTDERPNVTVRVVPLQAGQYAGLQGPFAVLEFEDEPSLVYMENHQLGMFSTRRTTWPLIVSPLAIS